MSASKLFGSVILLASLATTVHGGLRGYGQGGSSSNPTTEYVQIPYTFCVLGCTHVGWPFGGTNPRNWFQLDAFVDSMNTAGCAFGVICGDWAMDVTFPGGVDSLWAITGRANFPWHWVLGNHEALAADTTLGGNPYRTSASKLPFGGKNWGYSDTHNIRLICSQNNADVQVSNAGDYRVNNPFYGGWIPSVDWDGISDPASPQNQMIDEALAGRNGRTVVLVGHRPVYGSSDNNTTRMSYGRQGRGAGWVRRAEQALEPGERGLALFGDQHLVILTQAIADSAVAAANASAIYHAQMASGSGMRFIDTTNTFQAGTDWLEAYVGAVEGDLNTSRARTSEGVEDTLTVAGDPDIQTRWFGMTVTVYGDTWVHQVWRVPTANSAAADWFRGAGNLHLVHEGVWVMDVRNRGVN